MGVDVLGVSFDSPETNRAFAEKNALPFRLLSDSNRELARAVGAKWALLPVAKRVSYLIGPDGIVITAYPDVDPKTHARQVLADYHAIISSAE